ncbi:MAG: hypothetical protein M3P93_13610, partial [Actinomycetota bacterium]|nr:hypothetical protein [Actinomycetota bacterium]
MSAIRAAGQVVPADVADDDDERVASRGGERVVPVAADGEAGGGGGVAGGELQPGHDGHGGQQAGLHGGRDRPVDGEQPDGTEGEPDVQRDVRELGDDVVVERLPPAEGDDTDEHVVRDQAEQEQLGGAERQRGARLQGQVGVVGPGQLLEPRRRQPQQPARR